MKRHRSAKAVAIAILAATPVKAQDSEGLVERGAEVYESTCSYCHDPLPDNSALEMLPGVASLALKYDGAVSPYISERPELANAAVLTGFLRAGSGSMPPFRKTEVTDEDIEAIAAYFRTTSAD